MAVNGKQQNAYAGMRLNAKEPTDNKIDKWGAYRIWQRTETTLSTAKKLEEKMFKWYRLVERITRPGWPLVMEWKWIFHWSPVEERQRGNPTKFTA